MVDVKGDLFGLVCLGEVVDKMVVCVKDIGDDWVLMVFLVEFLLLGVSGVGVLVCVIIFSFGLILLVKVLGFNVI